MTLTPANILEIRRLYREGRTIKAIADAFNVSIMLIRHVLYGKYSPQAPDPLGPVVMRQGRPTPETARSTKLDWAAVREIRAECEAGQTFRAVAKARGLDNTTVSAIYNGRTWKDPEWSPTPGRKERQRHRRDYETEVLASIERLKAAGIKPAIKAVAADIHARCSSVTPIFQRLRETGRLEPIDYDRSSHLGTKYQSRVAERRPPYYEDVMLYHETRIFLGGEQIPHAIRQKYVPTLARVSRREGMRVLT